MKLLESVNKHLKEIAYLESSKELLGWDRQAHMPPAGATWRSEQSAYLATLIHSLKLDDGFYDNLNSLLPTKQIPNNEQ